MLGRHVLQRPPGEGLQGLGLQQLLHGHAAGHPVPVHAARHLHHRHHPALLRLRPLQVGLLIGFIKMVVDVMVSTGPSQG